MLGSATSRQMLMLVRTGLRLRRIPSVSRRCYSSIPDYHPKVRAVPFAFSSDAAITHVGTVASIATQTYSSLLKEDISRAIGSFFAKYLPSTNFKAIQPERIQAVYYPSWCVDAEAEAKAWFSSDPEDPSEIITVHFKHAELPGFGIDLGRISLRDENLTYESAKPFSTALTRQHGLDVICLPYNISPLELISRARDISFGPTKIDDDFRLDPRSIKFNLVAAYPVLLPVYVLQYVPQAPYSHVTVIVEAHTKPGRYFVHFVGGPDLKKLPAQDFFSEDFIAQDVSTVKCRFSPNVIAPRSQSGVSEELCSWMSGFFEDRDAPQRLVSRRPIDMDDHRVRQWTEEEVLPVHKWMQLGEDVVRLRGMVKTFSTINIDQVKIFEFPPQRNRDPKQVAAGLQGFFKAEAEKLQKLEEMRLSQTPIWWRQWQDGQPPKTGP